ncbi:LOW QUALITY PROTEIN: hypothetical protein V2J09_001696 [Rumex salicifolius]
MRAECSFTEHSIFPSLSAACFKTSSIDIGFTKETAGNVVNELDEDSTKSPKTIKGNGNTGEHQNRQRPQMKFCNVKTSRTPPPTDPKEPTNVAEAIASWGLEYVVITSVDRDDLPDQGSGHFAETVQKLKTLKRSILIEALVPDFCGDVGCVERMAKQYAHAGTLTKTSVMLGCGETPEQVVRTMEKRAAGVDVMTFGQYMRPSKPSAICLYLSA